MRNNVSWLLIAVFSVLLAASSIVQAEIPKYMVRELQDRSPEQLLIEVTGVEKRRSPSGTFGVKVGARVLEVEKSATGLKKGDDLTIRYLLHDPEKPLPPGSYPIELENGKVYRAYLGQVGMLKGIYSPKAASGSFIRSARRIEKRVSAQLMLPDPKDVKTISIKFDHPELDDVEFTATSADWKAIRAALLPAKPDQNPASWEWLGTVRIIKTDNQPFRVELYTTSKDPGAFAAGETFGQRVYYRGGKNAELVKAIKAAYELSKENDNRDSPSNEGESAKDTLNTRIQKLKDIQSVGGVSLADLDLKYVKPHQDKKTHFVIGGSNSTTTILSLTSINGIGIDALERQMRPGAPGTAGSSAGFLGRSERLLQVMADDNRFVLEQQGLTHQNLARPLLLLGYYANEHYFSWEHGNGKEVRLGDLTFIVRAVRYHGEQDSPFMDGTSTDTDVTIINKQTGHGLTYSLLVPQMIERYGFYEGKGTSYRVDPRMIIDLFRAETSTVAGQYQRLPFQPITDRELKQALAVTAPAAVTALNIWDSDITDAGVAELSKLTNLKKLNLSGTKITDKSLAVISQLPNLTELHLTRTQITDDGLKHLSGLTRLTELSLDGNDISDEGLQALSKLTSLEDLGLSETRVTDEGMKALSPMKSLTELSLMQTGVSDKGLLTLSELPSLKKAHTYGTRVTKEGEEEFKRRLRERSSAGR